MQCIQCGYPAVGTQWPGMPPGYSICFECTHYQRIPAQSTTYGVLGVHYGIPAIGDRVKTEHGLGTVRMVALHEKYAALLNILLDVPSRQVGETVHTKAYFVYPEEKPC